jgi:hypothetical protein
MRTGRTQSRPLRLSWRTQSWQHQHQAHEDGEAEPSDKAGASGAPRESRAGHSPPGWTRRSHEQTCGSHQIGDVLAAKESMPKRDRPVLGNRF